MSTFILDGQGKGNVMGVNSENRALVHAVTEDEKGHAVEFGLAYNINTGNITLSAASALLYMKNNEAQNFIVEAVAVGLGAGTASDLGEITVIKNPTAGTLISGASAVSMNQNRNFGSSETLLNSLVYKGASGNTATGGSDVALFYQALSSRGYYTTGFEIPKGSSIAVSVDPKLSSGNCKCYVALIGYLKPFTEV